MDCLSTKLIGLLISSLLTSSLSAKTLNEIMHERRVSTSQPVSNQIVHQPVPTEPILSNTIVSTTEVQLQPGEVIINNAVIEPVIKSYLEDTYPEQEMKIKLPVINHSFHCPIPLANSDLQVEHIEFNRDHTLFKCAIKYCENVAPVIIDGQIENYISIPVLSHAIHNSEVISEKDITTIQIPINKIDKSTITKISDLIGTEPKNNILKPNVQINKRDVIRPYEVKKGALVTITYIKPKMVISAKGKALGNGHIGDIIDVENIDSKKVVKTTIEGTNHVFIKAATSFDQFHD